MTAGKLDENQDHHLRRRFTAERRVGTGRKLDYNQFSIGSPTM